MVLEEKLQIETCENIFRALNTTSPGYFVNLLYHKLSGEHRTLQQNFWRMIQDIAEKYAKEDDRFFDARNEAAHNWTKKITTTDMLDFLPHY